ncbi:MAG: hypothetical protein EHM28_07225 [Spirochaetaceae bacterium]|nr:MAG: hypothetical protein EHM28_07225 [Spirochaetaceae bacterium]
MHHKSCPLRLFYICTAILLFFFSCFGTDTDRQFPKKIIMNAGQTDSPASLRYLSDKADNPVRRPDISLESNEGIVYVVNVNLDMDAHEEQVIAVKDNTTPDAPVKIITADFDSTRNIYIRSWETSTKAVNIGTLRINLKDISQDQIPEIIASGTDSSGKITLDIYRNMSPYSSQLFYSSACSLIADGTIEIIENTIGAMYSAYGGSQAGFDAGAFPIVLLRSNPETQDYTDAIREIYSFQPASGHYELRHQETISQKAVGESQLSVLYQSANVDLFADYLKGVWQRVDENGKQLQQILSFDPFNKEIIFFMDNIQEIYRWKYSHRSLYNMLLIYTENALLTSIKPNVTVVLSSLTEISIQINDYGAIEQWLNDQWGGKYTRISKDSDNLQSEYAVINSESSTTNTGSADAGLSAPLHSMLSGTFKNETGDELVFNDRNFIWKTADKKLEGGFAILFIQESGKSRLVLSMKIIEDHGLVVTNKVFHIGIRETSDKIEITLTPAVWGVYGISESRGAPLTFRRPTIQ